MKKYMYIIIAVIIIVALAILLTSRKEESISPFASSAHTERYCFLYENTVTNEEGEELGTDREYIEFALNPENSEIQGIHNVVPVTGDGHYATLIGVTDQGYMNAVATVDYQDTTWQEQRIYRFDDEHLYVGYQPVDVPRMQNEFGVYMYEDIYEITFATDAFYLNKISCTDFDVTTVLKNS